MKTEADLNAELRELLMGDDGSVACKPERLNVAVQGWCRANRYNIVYGFTALAIDPTSPLLLIDEMNRALWKCGDDVEHPVFRPEAMIYRNRTGDWGDSLETYVANYRELAPDYDWFPLLRQVANKINRGVEVGCAADGSVELCLYGTWGQYGEDETADFPDDTNLPQNVKQWAVDVLRAQRESLTAES